jgi:[protein-PII] uridylyltransferase
LLIHHHKDDSPLVSVRIDESVGTLEVFIYMPSRDHIFFSAVNLLSQMNLSVVNAHVMMCKNHYAFETFKVVSEHQDEQQLQYLADEITRRLGSILSGDIEPGSTKWTATRAQKHFRVETKVRFSRSHNRNTTRLQIDTADRQGLLAIISRILSENHARIHDAFVSTAGEKAIDYFDITDMRTSQPLDEQQQNKLRDILIREL